jgi:hypothetical protein
MNYLIVLPEAGLDSGQRADAISEELYALGRPPQVRQPDDVTRYVFGRIKHPDRDEYALQVILDYGIYVHPDNDIDGLIALFPEVPEQEKEALSAYIESQVNRRFPFGNIIPSTATVRDGQYMEDNGWFPDAPIE